MANKKNKKNEQLGKLGELATEQRERTDLGFDLGEREEQVACHVSALALAMTDEARRYEPGDLHHFCERQRKPYVFH